MATLKELNKDIAKIKKQLSHLKLDVYSLEAVENVDEASKSNLYSQIAELKAKLDAKLKEKTVLLGD
ncbi:MAG: hypothetical protein CVV63_05010, partial [Tenericutes bacterium HGW-Tenericutes-8]